MIERPAMCLLKGSPYTGEFKGAKWVLFSSIDKNQLEWKVYAENFGKKNSTELSRDRGGKEMEPDYRRIQHSMQHWFGEYEILLNQCGQSTSAVFF